MVNPRAPFLYQDRPAPAGTKVFGVAGGSLNSAGFDASSTKAGIDGERRVGKVLDEFASKNSNVYAFHSVKFPGHFGDIDHVLIVGSTVIAIDTKNWKSDASYTISRDGETVLRDGNVFPGGKVSVKRYVGELRSFTDLSARGLLVVSNSRSKTQRDPDTDWDFVNLTALSEVIYDEVRAQRRVSASPAAIAALASRVVNPDYSGEWEGIVHAEREKDGGTRYAKAPVSHEKGNSVIHAIHRVIVPIWAIVFVALTAVVIVQPIFFPIVLPFNVPPTAYAIFAAIGIVYGLYVHRATAHSGTPKGIGVAAVSLLGLVALVGGLMIGKL